MNILPTEALGKRICIIGGGSCGKSTLAAALGKKMCLETVIHLDQLAHIPNTQWTPKPREEIIAEHSKIIEKDSWIIEGNYSYCLPERIARATHIIRLDFPFWFSIANFIIRCHFSKKERFGMLEGARDFINIPLLLQSIKKRKKQKTKYDGIISNFPNTPVTIIHSMKELNEYYKHWEL